MPTATSQVITGVVVSVVIGCALAALIVLTSWFCCAPPTKTSSPQMDAWREKASNTLPGVIVGIVLQSLGLVTGFAAPAIPWFSTSLNLSVMGYSGDYIVTAFIVSYQDSMGNTITMPNVVTIIGAAIAYLALATMVLPSLCFAWLAACRLKNVKTLGAAPPPSCCSTGMPAIMGLAWAGTIVFLFVLGTYPFSLSLFLFPFKWRHFAAVLTFFGF